MNIVLIFTVLNFSDTMDNLGAFITLNGKELKPNFTTYEAVVSSMNSRVQDTHEYLR